MQIAGANDAIRAVSKLLQQINALQELRTNVHAKMQSMSLGGDFAISDLCRLPPFAGGI